jgi:hypothetical protein
MCTSQPSFLELFALANVRVEVVSRAAGTAEPPAFFLALTLRNGPSTQCRGRSCFQEGAGGYAYRAPGPLGT